MTYWEIFIMIGVAAVVIWWAHTAVFDACEECTYDCKQGRNCPNKK